MKNFLSKIFILLFPVIILYIIAIFLVYNILTKSFTIPNQNLYSYCAKERLDSFQKVKHKIIIVGGSNVLFGIDPYLFKSLTKANIVDLGRYRADGVENMLILAKKIYNKNDIILFSLEYGEISSANNSGNDLSFFLTRSLIYILKPNYLLTKIENSFFQHPNLLLDERLKVYTSFDQNFYLKGLDSINKNYNDQFLNEKGYNFKNDPDDIKNLNTFKKKGYNIYAFHPTLCRELLTSENMKELETNPKSLPIPYITKQSDYIFGKDSIFDFPFHLNKNGRRSRTIKLANDFNKLFTFTRNDG